MGSSKTLGQTEGSCTSQAPFTGKETHGPHTSIPQLHILESDQIVLEAGHLRNKACKCEVILGWLGYTKQQNLPFYCPTLPTPTLIHLPLSAPGLRPARVGGRGRGGLSRTVDWNHSLDRSLPLCLLRDHGMSPILFLLPPEASLTLGLEFPRALANILAKCSFPLS